MRGGAVLSVVAVACAGALSAQIDPSAPHRTLHTAHFRVHFRPPHRPVALVAAREAERAWALLAQELAPPRGTIDLLLTDELDFPNGLAGVFPSSRVTIFLPPPATGGIADFDTWLRLVITHELAHVFHLDRAGGVWGVLQTVFGRAPGLFPNAYQPSWVAEGLATYFESRYTLAGRVPSSFHHQILRAERMRHVDRDPNDATFVEIRWPGGNTPYAYGARFFAHLAGSASDTVIGAFVEATGHQWIPYRVGRQVRRVSGRPLAAAWDSAVAQLDGDVAGTPTAAARWVVAERLLGPPSARLSPDGARLAYVRDDGMTARRAVVLDLATRTEVASHLLNAFPELAWAGDTLLVTQLDWTGRYQARSDLYRWSPDGGGWRRVTRAARLVRPEAGGGRIAAIRIRPGGREPVAIGAGGTVAPMDVPDGAVWGQVAPAPDGRVVGGVRHARGAWDVVVWDVGTAAPPVEVTRDAAVEADLAWAPDGTLLFSSDAGGLPQVYAWSPADGTMTRLTDAPNGAREPQLGADGTLFYSTIDAHGHALVAVTPERWAAQLDRDGGRAVPEAPAIEPRETGYDLWPALRPKYWMPYVAAAGGGRFFVGGLTSGSDVLERNAYVAAIGVDAVRGRWQGYVSFRDARFGRPVMDLSASQEWSGDFRLSDGTTVAVRERDAAVGATWLWRRWRWDARLRAAAEYEQDSFEPQRFIAQEYAGSSLALSVARSVTPTLAISRERGLALSVLLRRHEGLGRARWWNEGRGFAALFLPTPFPRHVIALRASAGVTGGPDARRFGVGGVSGRPVSPVAGITLGESRSFPVRGYASSTLTGTRATSATLEYRAPLVYVGRGVASLPLGVIRLSGAAFGEVGGAWNSGEARRPTALGSVGAELALDLTISYDAPFRLRLGVAAPLREAGGSRVGRAVGYVTLGSDF